MRQPQSTVHVGVCRLDTHCQVVRFSREVHARQIGIPAKRSVKFVKVLI
jgi:hypothetical protein